MARSFCLKKVPYQLIKCFKYFAYLHGPIACAEYATCEHNKLENYYLLKAGNKGRLNVNIVL